MRKSALVVAAVLLAIGIGVKTAYAQTPVNPATITVTVTVVGTVAITIDPATITLGTVFAGASTISTTSVNVTATGSGYADLSLAQLGSTAAWQMDGDHGTPTGTNLYILAALFNSTQPPMGSFTIGGIGGATFDVIGTAFTEASETEDGVYTGNQTGSNLPPNATRNLWFAFWAPTVTSTSASQSITVYLRAEPH